GGVSASTAPGALTQPEASAAPQVDTAAIAVPDTAEAAPEPDEIAGLDASDPDTPDLPTPRFPTIGDGAAADAEEAGTQGNAILQFPQNSRLPQAGGGASDEEEDEIAREIPEEEEEIAPEDLPAIRAYAADFDATEARPLMAIVLIDDPDSPIEQATLTRFTFPVAFAVDPMQPDAAARARVYREAGFEVVMLGTMLPEGATAMDTEVAVIAAQAVLPETVALLDTPEGRIQGDRPVLDATVGLLAETGHGLLAFPRGLNAAEQTASRAGVPAATAFRLLDDEDQRATEITRYLARAAFAAGQDGTVIVAGRTRPDTVTALFSWALGDRSEAVALAPLSAVLLRAAGE
ncbi:hypothetical protein HKCCE4037_16675, partial [Rhodobacterales bacterium HKCCE4037]|nr:hypothetical protein [Rhodobacterales bacterium HKCCE4037]